MKQVRKKCDGMNVQISQGCSRSISLITKRPAFQVSPRARTEWEYEWSDREWIYRRLWMKTEGYWVLVRDLLQYRSHNFLNKFKIFLLRKSNLKSKVLQDTYRFKYQEGKVREKVFTWWRSCSKATITNRSPMNDDQIAMSKMTSIYKKWLSIMKEAIKSVVSLLNLWEQMSSLKSIWFKKKWWR